MKKADAFFMEAPPPFFPNLKGKQNEVLTPPMTFKFLLPALTACLLTACGGSDDDGMGNPADRPSASEQQAFEASKVGAESLVGTDGSRSNDDRYRVSIGNTTLVETDGKTGRHDYRSLPAGFSSQAATVTFPAYNNASIPATMRSYQGFRSGVVVTYYQGGPLIDTYGVKTAAAQLPQSGSATYNGTAFDRNDRGTLSYQVDFGARTGEGRIEGLGHYGTITLARGNFQTVKQLEDGAAGIVGTASAKYTGSLPYEVVFYGHGAEEIAGGVMNDAKNDYIGFHGTRGEISQ